MDGGELHPGSTCALAGLQHITRADSLAPAEGVECALVQGEGVSFLDFLRSERVVIDLKAGFLAAVVYLAFRYLVGC
jgi:hypothetical protein